MSVSFSREANVNVEMKVLDEQLRCSICFEFFNDCMMTKCSHNYCSFCIRNYLCYNDSCPICSQTIAELDLRNNRQLDCVVSCFKDLRLKLVEILKTNDNCGKDGVIARFSDRNEEMETIKLNDIDVDDEKECKKVSCPICSITIGEKNIKEHVDNCKKLCDRNHVDTSKECFLPPPCKRPYLSKKVYRFIKEKDLRAELGKYVSELVKEIEASEQRLKYECERIKTSEMKMTVNRNSCLDDIEKQRTEYLKFHRDQFSNLLDRIKTKNVDVDEPSTSGIDSKKCRSATSFASSVSRTTRSRSKVSDAEIGQTSNLRKAKFISVESSESDEDLDDFAIFKSRKRIEPTSRTTRVSNTKKK